MKEPLTWRRRDCHLRGQRRSGHARQGGRDIRRWDGRVCQRQQPYLVSLKSDTDVVDTEVSNQIDTDVLDEDLLCTQDCDVFARIGSTLVEDCALAQGMTQQQFEDAYLANPDGWVADFPNGIRLDLPYLQNQNVVFNCMYCEAMTDVVREVDDDSDWDWASVSDTGVAMELCEHICDKKYADAWATYNLFAALDFGCPSIIDAVCDDGPCDLQFKAECDEQTSEFRFLEECISSMAFADLDLVIDPSISSVTIDPIEGSDYTFAIDGDVLNRTSRRRVIDGEAESTGGTFLGDTFSSTAAVLTGHLYYFVDSDTAYVYPLGSDPIIWVGGTRASDGQRLFTPVATDVPLVATFDTVAGTWAMSFSGPPC